MKLPHSKPITPEKHAFVLPKTDANHSSTRGLPFTLCKDRLCRTDDQIPPGLLQYYPWHKSIRSRNPLEERMNMIRYIADAIWAPVQQPPWQSSSSSVSSGPSFPPLSQSSSHSSRSFMPTNELGISPLGDDEDLAGRWTSSRAVFRWTNGFSYDLQTLMLQEHEDSMAEAWDSVYAEEVFTQWWPYPDTKASSVEPPPWSGRNWQGLIIPKPKTTQLQVLLPLDQALMYLPLLPSRPNYLAFLSINMGPSKQALPCFLQRTCVKASMKIASVGLRAASLYLDVLSSVSAFSPFTHLSESLCISFCWVCIQCSLYFSSP